MAADPAAISIFPSFTSGAIGTRLPRKIVWFEALKYDPTTNIFIAIVENTGLSDLRSNLYKLHSLYCQPAHMGTFYLEHGVLHMKEIFENDIKYVNFQVALESLRNVIFATFHANLIGGYHDAFDKFNKISQRYLWPGMYQYCKRIVTDCLGWSLGHRTMRCSVGIHEKCMEYLIDKMKTVQPIFYRNWYY